MKLPAHRQLHQPLGGDRIAHLQVVVAVGRRILLVVGHVGQTLVDLTVVVVQDLLRVVGELAPQISQPGRLVTSAVLAAFDLYRLPVSRVRVALALDPFHVGRLHRDRPDVGHEPGL